jgi:hypothetical protein
LLKISNVCERKNIYRCILIILLLIFAFFSISYKAVIESGYAQQTDLTTNTTEATTTTTADNNNSGVLFAEIAKSNNRIIWR